MKAVRKLENGHGHVACVQVEEPKTQRDQVKIQVYYSGICGTDMHFYEGEIKMPVTPITLGHEFSGVVVEIGEDVKGIQVGDRVTTETAKETCGICDNCRTGKHALCTQRRALGQQLDGAMAEYVCMPYDRVHKVPDAVSLEEAALTEPSCIAYHAVIDLTQIKPQELAVVIGPGPIGLLTAQMAASMGAKVVVLGRQRNSLRLELAKTLGADDVIMIDKEDPVKKIKEMTDGLGADYVFECSGKDDGISQAIQLCKKGGTMVEIGVTNPQGSTITSFYQAVMSEVKIQCSFSHRYLNWDRVLRMMETGRLQVKPLISHKFPLEQCEEAFLAKDKIKVLFEVKKENL